MCKRSSTLPKPVDQSHEALAILQDLWRPCYISVIVLLNDNELSTRLIGDGDRRSILAERVVTLRATINCVVRVCVFSLLRLIVVFLLVHLYQTPLVYRSAL